MKVNIKSLETGEILDLSPIEIKHITKILCVEGEWNGEKTKHLQLYRNCPRTGEEICVGGYNGELFELIVGVE